MRRRFLTSFALVPLLFWSKAAHAEAPAKVEYRLDPTQPIQCGYDENGRQLHVQSQHDKDGKELLLVAATMNEAGETLDRLENCRETFPVSTMAVLKTRGVPLVTAIAEAPQGWHRDERGRVFQVTFDMLKRFQLGIAYNPTWSESPGRRDLGRMRLEMGLVASWLDAPDRTRHEIQALRGDVAIPDLQMRGMVFSYEQTRSSKTPLLRLTTFFGTPRRHDITLDAGFGLRVVTVENRPHRAPDLFDIEYGRLYGTWALWYSPDMASRLVLRGGAGGGQLRATGEGESSYHYLAPVGGLDARFFIDRSGFHQLSLEAETQTPFYFTGGGDVPHHLRASGALAHEWILFAIDDQPISLRTEANVSYRSDLPERAAPLEAQGLVGLRFSFWAPGRLDERIAPPKSTRLATPAGLEKP
jgi:hypothetical protein